MDKNAPSVYAHGAGMHEVKMPTFSSRDMPGYAAPTRSSSSKTKTTTYESVNVGGHRPREHRSRERNHRSTERDNRSKSREKNRSTKYEDNKHVAFQAHTLPARLPSSARDYYDENTKHTRRRPRQSKSADGRARVVPPWATTENPVEINESCFFSNVRSPRPSFFFIHPEWSSESISRRRLNIIDKPQVVMSGRRCFSAPPPRSRNPITWEYS